jgi:hypothetical protein
MQMASNIILTEKDVTAVVFTCDYKHWSKHMKEGDSPSPLWKKRLTKSVSPSLVQELQYHGDSIVQQTYAIRMLASSPKDRLNNSFGNFPCFELDINSGIYTTYYFYQLYTALTYWCRSDG